MPPTPAEPSEAKVEDGWSHQWQSTCTELPELPLFVEVRQQLSAHVDGLTFDRPPSSVGQSTPSQSRPSATASHGFKGFWSKREAAQVAGASLFPALSEKVQDAENSEREKSARHSDLHQQRGVFMDAEAMKEKVRKNLFKEVYDVSKFYNKCGVWQAIATNPSFDKLTLFVIAMNAIYIGVDTDGNNASTLLEADPIFQVAEHSFCAYFAFEWFVRFGSFARKRNCFRDAWFVFDTILVFMMVLETWVLSAVAVFGSSGAGGGLGNVSVLRMARLARMARMARLLRAMPELMIIIKGVAAATRSVFYTLVLLSSLLYIFAIAFTQLTEGTEVGELWFRDVSTSAYTLLMRGTLMDGIGEPLRDLGREGFMLVVVFFTFVLLATVTVMNMLIGVLCEVVSAVAAVEKETLALNWVKYKVQGVLRDLDDNGNGTISKDEFHHVLESKIAVRSFDEIGVDVEGLADLIDVIFQDRESVEDEKKDLTFQQFMEIILQFRGTNTATVKDIVDFNKFVKQRVENQTNEFRNVKTQIRATEPPVSHDYKKVIIEAAKGGNKVPIGKIAIFPDYDTTHDEGTSHSSDGDDSDSDGERGHFFAGRCPRSRSAPARITAGASEATSPPTAVLRRQPFSEGEP